MTIRTEFLDLTKDTGREDIQSYAKVDDAEVVRIQSNIDVSEESINELLQREHSEFSMLKTIQNEVRRDISGDDGSSKILSSMLSTVGKVVVILLSSMDTINARAGELETSIQSPPRKIDTEEILSDISELEDSAYEIRNIYNQMDSVSGINRINGSNQSNFVEDLSSKLNIEVSPNDIQGKDVLGQVYSSSGRVQVVKKLSDDFYKLVNESEYNTYSAVKSFKLEDLNGGIVEEVEGATSFVLSGRDTIDVNFIDGSVKRYRVIYDAPLSIKTKQKLKLSEAKTSVINSAISKSKKIEESLGFEIWSCLVLDMADDIYNVWSNQIKPSLLNLVSLFRIQSNIITGFPTISFPAIGTSVFSDMTSLSNALSAIKTPSEFIIDTLGVRNSLLDNSTFSGNTTLCQLNHKNYCAINLHLSNMIRNLLFEIDGLALKLDSLDISFDISFFVDKLNIFSDIINSKIEDIDKLVEKLRKDICAWVSKRNIGKPKTLSLIIASFLSIIPVLTSISLFASPSEWGLTQSDVINKAIEKLKRFKYDYAAEILESGDIQSFLSLTENECTKEGRAAILLKDAAESENNPSKRLQLNQLAYQYEDEDVSKRASSMVSQMAVNRYRFDAVNKETRSKNMRDLGDNLL